MRALTMNEFGFVSGGQSSGSRAGGWNVVFSRANPCASVQHPYARAGCEASLAAAETEQFQAVVRTLVTPVVDSLSNTACVIANGFHNLARPVDEKVPNSEACPTRR